MRALQLIPPLAKSGDPFAQWLLGDMYKNGEGLPPFDGDPAVLFGDPIEKIGKLATFGFMV